MQFVRIPESLTLQLRVWGVEAVAYNVVSSETHLLCMPAARVLQLLEIGPRTFEALNEALAPETVDLDPDERAVYVRDAVWQFSDLGLLEVIGIEA